MANKKVNKVGKEFDKVVDEMKKLAPKFAKADLDEKQKILKKLKELTAKKKDLRSQIERTVMDAEKDIELQIEIRKMLKTAVTKKLNEGSSILGKNLANTWTSSDAAMKSLKSFLEVLYQDGNYDTMDDMQATFSVLSKLAKDYLKAMK
tara:strand:+ start:415 stop:861 length:447 start_codon:yes stop_codon:yes gene_type:complete